MSPSDLPSLDAQMQKLIERWRTMANSGMIQGPIADALLMCADELAAAALTVGAEQPKEDVDVQLLAWAVSNCHTLARRELNRLRPYVVPDTLAIERWEHVLRICEKAGARSRGVLRAALPTEITDGGSDGNEQAWADLQADGGLPESHAVGAEPPQQKLLTLLDARIRQAEDKLLMYRRPTDQEQRQQLLGADDVARASLHWSHWNSKLAGLREARQMILDAAVGAERGPQEIERLTKLAYIGEHQFPDLTWKARAEELIEENIRLKAERGHSQPPRKDLLKRVEKFIEYARYVLEPGKPAMRQFPSQGDADDILVELKLEAAGVPSQPPTSPPQENWTARRPWPSECILAEIADLKASIGTANGRTADMLEDLLQRAGESTNAKPDDEPVLPLPLPPESK